MRSYQALEDAHNINSGKRRRFAGAAVLSKLSAVIDGMVRVWRFGSSCLGLRLYIRATLKSCCQTIHPPNNQP